ncbi:THAP domain-containing protein 3-like [Ostrinia furnacalis]|uniref:THAP domain-containing protein 3-like n=1 Tax=Ostrinia furnacalis TaxID=93504 RepID=UPI00103CD9F1|nr:THAP domain-containing protein 3-like [Ostrinia furnacalis]
MTNCVLRYCSNNIKTNNKSSDGVTFHKLPHPGNSKRDEWIQFIQKNRSEKDWVPKHTSICSKHFREEDYYFTKTGRKYLKKNAMPYENPESNQSSENPEHNQRPLPPTKPVYVSDTGHGIAALPARRAAISCSVVSDLECAKEIPGNIKLKKELFKVTADKNELIKKNIKLRRLYD